MGIPYEHQDPDDDDVSGDLSGSFLTQADFAETPAITFRIADAIGKKVFEAKNGRPEEEKRVLTFTDERRLSLNKTNLRLCAKWFGTKARAWADQVIVVYLDESVSFGGRLTGGLRVRKPTPDELRAFLRAEGQIENEDVSFTIDDTGELVEPDRGANGRTDEDRRIDEMAARLNQRIPPEQRATKPSRKLKTKDRAHA